jgi:UDP-glucose 4-epimerase
VLRIANPFGPFQAPQRSQGVIAALVGRALAGQMIEIWGDGTVVRDFLHIDDVVSAVFAVLAYDGPHRIFNVGSGVGRSVNDIVTDLELLLGRGELLKAYLPARRADVPVNILDVGLLRRETGWAPRMEWMAALRDTVAWLGTYALGSPGFLTRLVRDMAPPIDNVVK